MALVECHLEEIECQFLQNIHLDQDSMIMIHKNRFMNDLGILDDRIILLPEESLNDFLLQSIIAIILILIRIILEVLEVVHYHRLIVLYLPLHILIVMKTLGDPNEMTYIIVDHVGEAKTIPQGHQAMNLEGFQNFHLEDH